jgi:two-component system KDP operon response regulator KdpE
MMEIDVLLIEDEPSIVRMLQPTIGATGARVQVAWSGSQALEYVAAKPFNVILCDLGLPDVEGEHLIGKLRQTSNAPIIVLSARGSEDDKIRALDAGADDFVAKPFSAGELLARIRASVRRGPGKQVRGHVDVGDLRIDLDRRRAVLEGVEIRLSGREHVLLRLLGREVGKIVTHRQIIDEVWGAEGKADTQFVRVLVGQLRQKLEEDPSNPQIVCTEPGLGYRLVAPNKGRSSA